MTRASARISALRSADAFASDIDIDAKPGWRIEFLQGQLIELSGHGATATLTLAFSLVLSAQQQRETTAWVTAATDLFYPPDVQAGGVDLGALVIIKAGDATTAARAADKLLRSGAFGLVVLDLGGGRNKAIATVGDAGVTTSSLARLLKLARRHNSTVLCLTDKQRWQASLGALVSLRCQAIRSPAESGTFRCQVEVLKNKRGGPGWSHEEICRGPGGLG
jgi:recombination protein RecA